MADAGADAGSVNGMPGGQDSEEPARPTLNTSVRRRRADRAFYLRLAGAIRQNERAIERLKR
jgi:hypothetical protein